MVKTLLRAPLVLLGVVVILFEEVLWAWLGRLMALIGRYRPVARVEAAIRRLPPYPAMLLFLLPWAIIVPVKLVALWLIALGKLASGAFLFISGEILGVAVLARLYALCRPSLLSLAWFLRVEAVILRWTAWAHGLLDQILPLRLVRTAARRLSQGLHGAANASGWLASRLRAARRMAKVVSSL